MTGARFVIGDRVQVSNLACGGHNRTPRYARGQKGVITHYCGAFPNPELLAQGEDGLPKKDLYRVRFAQTALWPGYRGTDVDTLDIEIYDHWLKPVSATAGGGDAP